MATGSLVLVYPKCHLKGGMEVWEGIRSSEISSVIEAAKIKVPNSVIVKPCEDEDVVGMGNF